MPQAGDPVRASDAAVQGCEVMRTVAQSIPHNTTTTIAFDDEEFDNDGMHSTSVNNSRITIRTAGIYTIGFTGALVAGGDYTRYHTLFLLNGTITLCRSSPATTTAVVRQHDFLTRTRQFSINDYIEVQMFQLNGAAVARNLDVVAEFSPRFYAARIGS